MDIKANLNVSGPSMSIGGFGFGGGDQEKEKKSGSSSLNVNTNQDTDEWDKMNTEIRTYKEQVQKLKSALEISNEKYQKLNQ